MDTNDQTETRAKQVADAKQIIGAMLETYALNPTKRAAVLESAEAFVAELINAPYEVQK